MSTKILLHCNKCYTRITNSNQQLFIANCGNILCFVCARQSAMNKTCVVCKMAVSILPVNKKLSPSIFNLFQPIDVLYASVKKILNFQMENKLRMEHALSERYNMIKKEYQRLQEAFKILTTNNEHKNQTICQLRRRGSNNAQRAPFPDNSMSSNHSSNGTFGRPFQPIGYDSHLNQTYSSSVMSGPRGNNSMQRNTSNYLPLSQLFIGAYIPKNVKFYKDGNQ